MFKKNHPIYQMKTKKFFFYLVRVGLYGFFFQSALKFYISTLTHVEKIKKIEKSAFSWSQILRTLKKEFKVHCHIAS